MDAARPMIAAAQERRHELFAALALALVYLAFASGHYQSIDGMLIFHQARSILYDGSLRFEEPFVWGGAIPTSKYGIGLSLLYLPGLLVFSWLEPYVHEPRPIPMDYGRLYVDPVYTVVGAPLQIVITAVTAYLVARFCRGLGLSRRHALAALALYGIASPALSYSRGDYPQPLLGLLWIGGIYTAVLHTRTGATRNLFFAAAAVLGAVLTRPVEGMLLLPAVLLIALHGYVIPRARFTVVSALAGAALLGLSITLAVNYGRYGSPLATGYEGEGWGSNWLLGMAGLLVSPARGLLWAFPAVVLVPVGAHALFRRDRSVSVALAGLCAALLLLMSGWHMWWGGVNWGPRLLVPALPLLAVCAAAGIDALAPRLRTTLPVLLGLAGAAWALPTAVIDLNTYGGHFDSSLKSFALVSHPLLFALRAPRVSSVTAPLNVHATDIIWWRLTGVAGAWPLLVFAISLALAIVLFYRVATESRAFPSEV